MKAKVLCGIILIIVLGAIGCTPPVPCLEGEDIISEMMGDFVDCTDIGMVCNEGVKFSTACSTFIEEVAETAAYFGADINDFVPDMCAMLDDNDPFNLLDLIGSCQALGEDGAPCAEGADCESTVCTNGVCEGVSV